MTHTVFIFICLMAIIIVSVCAILHALYVIKKMREALKEAMKIIDSQNEVINGTNKIVEAFALKSDALFVNSKMKDYNIVLDKLEAMPEDDSVSNAASRMQVSVEDLNEAAKQFRKVGEAALE